MGALDALPMRGTEGAFFPFFSPDGNWVGFFSGDSVKKVLLTGGPPITLTATGSVPQLGASWSADGTVLFTHVQAPGIMRVSEAGGEAQPLTTGDDEVRHQWMDSLPDGKGVLFTLWSGSLGTTRIAVQSPDMTEPMVLADGTDPRYVPTGHIVFARDNSLWAMPFDLEQLMVTGEPTPVLEDVLVVGRGDAQFAVADDGALVYIPGGGTFQRQLVWVGREGNEEPLDQSPQGYVQVRISPDGRRIAAMITDQGNRDIWIVDSQRGTSERLTSDSLEESHPAWTPDGRQVAFYSGGRDGGPGIWWRSAEGTNDPERLSTGQHRELAWAPNGTQLFFIDVDSQMSLGMLDLDDGSSRLLIEGAQHNDPAVSRDGRWLAYESNGCRSQTDRSVKFLAGERHDVFRW